MQLEPNNLIKKYELAEGQKDYIKNIIQETEKPIIWTDGLSYRCPATYHEIIDKEQAIKILNNKRCLYNFYEYDNCLYLNTFSESDFF